MPVSILGTYLLDNSQKLVLDPKWGQGWYVEELHLAKIGNYVYNGLFKIKESLYKTISPEFLLHF